MNRSLGLMVACLLMTLTACITRFDIDAGGSDGGVRDVVLLFDSALTDTRGVGQDRTAAPDRRADDAGGRDQSTGPDHRVTTDAASSRDHATVTPDTAVQSDASGSAQIGQHCENRPCVGDAICIGDSTTAYCRQRCQAGLAVCDPQTEYCSTVTLPDGGVSPNGACVPGQDFSEECLTANCSQVFICVFLGADAAARSCHARCQPAASDAGCPGGSGCVNINGQDGGACF